MNFDLIKQNFDRGLWNELMVSTAVAKGIITAKEFKDITGKTYSA